MKISTISTAIGTTVTLGSSSYSTQITVTASGDVFGVYGPAQAVDVGVLNYGFVGSYRQVGVDFLAPATLVNHGFIIGAEAVALAGGIITNFTNIAGGGTGVALNSGTLINSGSISAEYFGVTTNRPSYILNTGTIKATLLSGTRIGSAAVVLRQGSQLNNQGGTLSGLRYGVYGYGGTNTITNTGLITSTNWYGVRLSTDSVLDNHGGIYGYFGASLTNGDIAANSGRIIGQKNGVLLVDGITNDGVIEGVDGTGVVLGFGTTSSVINHGSIIGKFSGIRGTSPVYDTLVSIYNSGLIAGSSVALDIKGHLDLTVGGGGSFAGAVTDEDGTGRLVLAGTPAGNLDMGGSFSGFDSITFASSTVWTLAGTQAELAGGQEISGFGAHDTLVLDGFSASSKTFVSGTGLELSDDTSTVTLEIAGNFSTADFRLSVTPDSTTIVICFLAGTNILTAKGEILVEDLAIGDVVVTRFGGMQAIKWIGRQSFDHRFIRTNRDQIPVRITAGALGRDLPCRDLFISPGHSMLLDGVLILARNLVNGITIRQDEPTQGVHYYQLELADHDCVMAEDVWSETYADAPGLRAAFHNAADYYELYPEAAEAEELILCAPRPESGPALEAALRPVVARVQTEPGGLRGYVDICGPDKVEGWAWDEANPDLPVLLEVFAGEQQLGTALACHYRADLAAAGLGRGNSMFSFTLPSNVSGCITVYRAIDGTKVIPTDACRAAA